MDKVYILFGTCYDPFDETVDNWVFAVYANEDAANTKSAKLNKENFDENVGYYVEEAELVK